MRSIILNRIKTPDGTILTSYHRHDYKTYTDANGLVYMVDGGNDYLRRNIHDNNPYEELSIYSDAPFRVIRENFHRGGRGIDNKDELKWIPLCNMSDRWLENCIKYNEEKFPEAFSTKMYKKELKFRKKNNIKIKE